MKFLNKIDGASQVTTDSSNRFVTDAEKTKLAGIATAATKNDTDANLKNRANHTGSQTASTISDFASTVRSVALTGISLTTNAVISATDTILGALGKLQKQISDNLATLTGHTGSTSNPHSVTKGQVGLGNVDNTSDANKPISNTTQTALNGKVDNSRVLTDVPANAKFTDTIYTHPTTVGNKHIPSGGSSGQFLKWSSDGVGIWAADNDTTYSLITNTEIDAGVANTSRTISAATLKYAMDKVDITVGTVQPSSGWWFEEI